MAASWQESAVVKWVDQRLPIFAFVRHHLMEYPTPRNLNYLWNFGSIAGVMLVVMILTGVMLAMQYTASVDTAFDSVERIMRDVNYGWLLRYLHMNGGSFFMFAIYVHMFRGLYYGSYKAPREILWWLGVIILILMMMTAFMGYVLPWGQMSYWAATVITNLFSAVPVVGDAIVTWLWGGYSVDNPTLTRFYALHYLLSFVIFAVVFVHLWALHTVKSNNPTGVEPKTKQETIPFHPYYTAKDFYGFGAFFLVYLGFVFFAPNFFAEPDNYIPADSLVTPPHIVPEWYFLPFYAILRSVPDKLLGVIVTVASILVLFVLPWLDRSPVKSGRYRPIFKQLFWLLVVDCIVLGWVGANTPDAMFYTVPFLTIGRIATAYYFGHFLILLPLIARMEMKRPPRVPDSITAAGGKD